MYMNIQISRELYVCREIFGRAHIRLGRVFLAYLPNPFPILPPISGASHSLTCVGCVRGPVHPWASG